MCNENNKITYQEEAYIKNNENCKKLDLIFIFDKSNKVGGIIFYNLEVQVRY